jgi:nucleoside-diphosphate-sugar epimerase
LLEPELGIGPKEKARLSASVDVMIHSAADTSFLTQRRCRDTNIVGTENALALGKRFAKSPLFAHVSTACNVGEMRHRCLPEDEGCQASNRHHNEYTRSKAIAEERVIESGLDYLVVRPSIVLSAGLPDPVFARQILWIAPLFQEFERLPINPQARIDVVPVSYVAESLIALVQLDRRQHTCYHLSAGMDHSITMADWIDAINRNYSTREPLKLPTDGAWTKADEARYVTTPRQRKLYFAMRHYLPFLNMDLVFDNTRLREEVDVMRKGLAHPKTYLGELLDLIPFETAMEESANP